MRTLSKVSPSGSSLNVPLTPFTSMPAMVARPISTVSEIMRGRSIAVPSSAARPNANTPSTSSSAAFSSASSRGGFAPLAAA